jgi:hypothetical protein
METERCVNGPEAIVGLCPMRMVAGCWITSVDSVSCPSHSIPTVTASGLSLRRVLQ